MLVTFQNKERRIDEMNVHPDFVSIFSGQWPVLELLPTHLAVMLVHMLAYMEQIPASPSKIGECMTILTGVPVHLRKGDKCVVEADTGLIPKLGSCILGDNMVLGNSFADGTFRMLMEIGPLPARRMESFFPGAIDRMRWRSCSSLRTRRYRSATSSNRKMPGSDWGPQTNKAPIWASALIYKHKNYSI